MRQWHGNLCGVNVLVAGQVLSQNLDRHLFIPLLRLEQNDGPDIAFTILFRLLLQLGPLFNGRVHRTLPGVGLVKHHGQLDHVLVFEFLGADGVKDIVETLGSGGEFNQRRGVIRP